METKKLVFFCGLISVVFFGCTSGNCRSQQIKKEQMQGPAPIKDNKLLPEENQTNRVKVYKLDGTLQCSEGKKIEISEMEKELTKNNIKVYKSFSENDGMMRIQVCGSPTGNSNVYEINKENLKSAIELGFKQWSR